MGMGIYLVTKESCPTTVGQTGAQVTPLNHGSTTLSCQTASREVSNQWLDDTILFSLFWNVLISLSAAVDPKVHSSVVLGYQPQ